MQRLAAEIKRELGPETFVYRIRIGESSSDDRSSSFFDDVNRQVSIRFEGSSVKLLDR
jgi:hypothetical protein